jgi:hypothetical protein
MIKWIKREYEIKHSGEETDRLEIIMAFNLLAKMVEDAGIASVSVESIKTDTISVIVETAESP